MSKTTCSFLSLGERDPFGLIYLKPGGALPMHSMSVTNLTVTEEIIQPGLLLTPRS